MSLKKATNNASITYDTFQTQTENNVFQRSFANLTVGNLRTFSGDVYKAKVYTRDAHSSTDFQEIFDTFVVPENSLVNNSSINGFENIGFFHTGSIIAENWVSSSTTSNEAATFVSLDNSKLIDGLLISGSTNTLSKKVTFRTKNSVDLEKDVDYVLRFNSYFFKSIGERKDKDDTISTANHASLKIFISGFSNLNFLKADKVIKCLLDNGGSSFNLIISSTSSNLMILSGLTSKADWPPIIFIVNFLVSFLETFGIL